MDSAIGSQSYTESTEIVATLDELSQKFETALTVWGEYRRMNCNRTDLWKFFELEFGFSRDAIYSDFGSELNPVDLSLEDARYKYDTICKRVVNLLKIYIKALKDCTDQHRKFCTQQGTEDFVKS